MMKQKIMALIAAGMIMASSAPALAAETTTVGGDTPAESYTSTGTSLNGTITPIIISAVVPTQVAFNINPNKPENFSAGIDTEKAFTSPAFSIQNTCRAPLTLSVNSITAQAGNPAVVPENTFEDAKWKDLNKAETLSNIAFGFTTSAGWQKYRDQTGAIATTATSTDEWYTTTAPLVLGDIAGLSNAEASLKAKYGMAWGNTADKTIAYDVVYNIALAE